jgi:hypothetical protein
MRGRGRGGWFGDWAIWTLGENVGFNDSVYGCILGLEKIERKGRKAFQKTALSEHQNSLDHDPRSLKLNSKVKSL